MSWLWDNFLLVAVLTLAAGGGSVIGGRRWAQYRAVLDRQRRADNLRAEARRATFRPMPRVGGRGGVPDPAVVLSSRTVPRARVDELVARVEGLEAELARLVDELKFRPASDPIVVRLAEGPLTAELIKADYDLTSEELAERLGWLMNGSKQVEMAPIETSDPVYRWTGPQIGWSE